MNPHCSFIETLKYSKAHDTWASEKEFEHLHRLLSPKTAITKPLQQPLQEQNTTIPIIKKTGVAGPRTDNKARYENADQDKQKNLRLLVQQLYSKQRHNKFFQSLATWRYNYTPKQADAIERAYTELIGVIKPVVKEEDNTPWTTEEEENDPNWTPWD